MKKYLLRLKKIIFLGSFACFLIALIACSKTSALQPSDHPVPITALELEPNLPPTPSAASLFVTLKGDDSHDGKTETSAFRTLKRALAEARAGDTIFMTEGHYFEDALSVSNSGQAEAYLTIMAAPGDEVIIDWQGQRFGGIVFEGASYVVMRDLTLQNSPQQCMLLSDNASHNVFVNMIFSSCQGSGLQIFNGSYNIVAYSTAKDNTDNAGHADGFSSSGQGGESSHNEFWYNRAEHNADDGFDTWLSTHTLLHGNIAFDNGFNGGDGNGFKLGGEFNMAENIVRRNIAFNNSQNGFNTNSGGANTLDNNTAWNNASFNFLSTENPHRNRFRNNLSFAGDIGLFGNHTEQRNSWNLGISNPQFLSTDLNSEHFLMLSRTSPAIDKGVDLGLPFEQNAPDLGAREFRGK